MTIREGVAAVARTVLQLDARAVDRVFTVLAGWLMTGVFLDAWAHISRLPDSFWTPWHGVLYSGLTACGAFLSIARYLGRDRVELARGYDLSVIGFGIAALGGVADAIWHTIFGIEFNTEAAVSPSHMLVAGGILLVVTGPMRAAWDRRAFDLPAALSTIYGMSILAVIVDYANPFTRAFGAAPILGGEDQLDQNIALFSFMLYAAIVVGFVTLVLRRVDVPATWLGLVVGSNVLAMAAVNNPLHAGANGALLIAVLVSAVLIAIAAALVRPSRERPARLRAFGFLVPFAMYASYAIAIVLAFGTGWSPTFWSGLVMSGALTGLLVSTLATQG